MGIYKAEDKDIQDFKFGQLVPSESDRIINSDSFDLESFSHFQGSQQNITEDSIRNEREHESLSSFKISEVVRDHRGLRKQEQEDYERRVAEEVEKKITEIKSQAIKEGFVIGQEKGRSQAYAEGQKMMEEKLVEFTHYIENVRSDVQSIYADTKDKAYLMVKNLTKWVILKEVDEKYYLARLLEKLVHEINSTLNLVVHVNQDSFEYMPEIIKIVEKKIGKLTNVRVEVDLEMRENGIVLESENTIIDASLKAQFDSIDRLFTNVGLNE